MMTERPTQAGEPEMTKSHVERCACRHARADHRNGYAFGRSGPTTCGRCRCRLYVVGGTWPAGTTGEPTRRRDDDMLLTPAEVAALFGVRVYTVARWARAGLLAAVRTPGGRWRCWRSDVRALLERRGWPGGDQDQPPAGPRVRAEVAVP